VQKKLSASDRFRFYLKARAQGKSESDAVDELIEHAKLFPGTQFGNYSYEAEGLADGQTMSMTYTYVAEEAGDEQDLMLTLPMSKLEHYKRQHVNVTVVNKKLFSDSPTSLGM
jgi:hypothetical protein